MQLDGDAGLAHLGHQCVQFRKGRLRRVRGRVVPEAKHPEEPIHVRMGLNAGEPIREGERFFGKTVILAARISASCSSG